MQKSAAAIPEQRRPRRLIPAGAALLVAGAVLLLGTWLVSGTTARHAEGAQPTTGSSPSAAATAPTPTVTQIIVVNQAAPDDSKGTAAELITAIAGLITAIAGGATMVIGVLRRPQAPPAS